MFKVTPIDSKHESGCLELLEAAGQVFAEVGYQQATVREIVNRAGASLGAVNYHFRDKAGLYREVLTYAHNKSFAQFRKAASEPDPEQRLLHFVRTKLSHLLADDPAVSWIGRVLVAELVGMGEHNQEESFQQELFQQVIVPRQEILFGIIRELIGPEVSDEVVKRHAVSIVGQAGMYLICRPTVEMTYGRTLSEADLDWLSHHITRVSLAGIRAESGHGA